MKKALTLSTLVLGLFGLFSLLSAQESPVTTQSLSSMPLAFTKNIGQWDEQVQYRTSSGGATIWICRDKVVYQFTRTVRDSSKVDLTLGSPNFDPVDRFSGVEDSIEQLVITAKFVGANPNVEVVGEEMMDYKCNYFIGNNPAKWQTDVPNYEAVTLDGVYDGIDLHFSSGDEGELICQYAIAAGADVTQVKVDYEGAHETLFDAFGNTTVTSEWGDDVSCIELGDIFKRLGSPRVGLNSTRTVGSEKSLDQLDPASVRLLYSTYLGGSSREFGTSIGADAEGNAYVSGITTSLNYPMTAAYDSSFNSPGFSDIFVTKLAPDGKSLVYSTYIGGGHIDASRGLCVDPQRRVIICGYTYSGNFPMQIAIDSVFGGSEGFVVRLSEFGNQLNYSTYLGGSGNDFCFAICVDSTSSAVVTGYTQSLDFPLQAAYDDIIGGSVDAFVSKISGAGNELIYSTFLGGMNDELGHGICVDPAGYAYVTGDTYSADFPLVAALDAHLDGSLDAFVTKMSITGETLALSTYLGGSGIEYGRCIDVSGFGIVTVTGMTSSTDFPVKQPYDAYFGGAQDAFLTRLSTVGDSLIYSTYLGGSNGEFVNGLSLDSVGRAYVSGYSYSPDFPVTNSYDSVFDGTVNAFVTKFADSGRSLGYSTFLGGPIDYFGYGDIYADVAGNAYVTGYTSSSGFTIVQGYDSTYNGGDWDAFVAKLGADCSSGIDADIDDVDDECDNCINFRPVVTIKPTDTAIRMKSSYGYFPTVVDPDGSSFGITYFERPHWCSVRNDSIVGIAPDTVFVEPVEFELVDGCNVDTISFNVSVYLCGNANGDTLISITDPVFVINYIFAGGPVPQPYLQGDANCSGVVDITDAVYLINYIFASGAVPCSGCK